jgi:hypothetical protein
MTKCCKILRYATIKNILVSACHSFFWDCDLGDHNPATSTRVTGCHWELGFIASGCKWMQVDASGIFIFWGCIMVYWAGWHFPLQSCSHALWSICFVKSPKTTEWSSISLKGPSVTVLWGNLPRPMTISDFLRWDHMMDHVWQPCRTLIEERSVDYHFQTSTEFQWSCRIQSFCNHFVWGLCSSQGN